MSLSYYDDPKKQQDWERELRQMRQEKARRMTGKTAAEVSSRRPITYEQLFEQEYGAPKPQKLSRSSARQMEKNKEMDGKHL